jgi:hypothetical protein
MTPFRSTWYNIMSTKILYSDRALFIMGKRLPTYWRYKGHCIIAQWCRNDRWRLQIRFVINRPFLIFHWSVCSKTRLLIPKLEILFRHRRCSLPPSPLYFLWCYTRNIVSAARLWSSLFSSVPPGKWNCRNLWRLKFSWITFEMQFLLHRNNIAPPLQRQICYCSFAK